MCRNSNFARNLCLSIAVVSAVVRAGAAEKARSASKPGRLVAASDAPRARVFMNLPEDGVAVRKAVHAAARMLAEAGCQQVFSDFQDGSGRPLRDRLAELGQTGASYIGLVRFNEGLGQSRCSRAGVIAATEPGSRVVFVCGAQFRRAYDQDPSHVEAVVIHEVLHSLGLGENPPTSREITAGVRRRCH